MKNFNPLRIERTKVMSAIQHAEENFSDEKAKKLVAEFKDIKNVKSVSFISANEFIEKDTDILKTREGSLGNIYIIAEDKNNLGSILIAITNKFLPYTE